MSAPSAFAEHNNAGALELYGALRHTPGNLFLSPLSIRTALAMAFEGARGDTATQLERALYLGVAGESVSQSFSNARAHLHDATDDGSDIVVANSLWAPYGAAISPEYGEAIAQAYSGEMHLVDFARSEEAIAAINRWVSNRTRDRIRDVLSSGDVDAETRLVLVNAIYFKAKWDLRFDQSETRQEPFFVEAGANVQASLMRQFATMSYFEADGFQAVDLVYEGEKLSMLVLLPDRQDGLRTLENRLSPSLLSDCFSRLRFRDVRLFLPAFRFEWKARLRDALLALGIVNAFDPGLADFSGINGRRPGDAHAFFLSHVLHKAFVEVDEVGTEAAAATALTMTWSSGLFAPRHESPAVFRADHPFVFAIRDRGTGTILFLGRVCDPNG